VAIRIASALAARRPTGPGFDGEPQTRVGDFEQGSERLAAADGIRTVVEPVS